MLIKQLRIRNFRCIRDQRLDCSEITALIGSNGGGKSTVLKSLEAFYDGPSRLPSDDFHARQLDSDVEISVTYGALTDGEKDLFQPYLKDDTLTVTRIFTSDPSRPSGKYHASRLQNPDFVAVFRANTAAEKRAAYKQIRDERYPELPAWANQAAAIDALATWESNHPDRCAWLPDDGQFFGFSGVGKGNLSRFTRFVYVPAVRDAAEDVAEGRTSPITRLLDYLVRSVLSKNAEIEQLKADVQRRYTELTNPSNIAELAGLSRDLGSLLRTFYPQTDVRVAWQPPAEISLPLLKADVFLKEDGFESRVSHMGHGLQRAFILSILQHLAVVVGRRGTDLKSTPSDAESDVNTDSSDIDATMDYAVSLIVAIEEPELYQHPSRQRHFARVLRTLVDQGHENYDGKIQVLYSTHSPHFLSLAHFNEIRRVRKCISEHAEIAEAKLVHADGERVAIGLWRAASAAGSQSDPFTFATLQPRLHIITPDVAEGFFADLVILVEGPTDHAAIVGVANYMGVNLEAENIAVIACGAKANLDRPKEIFSALEIPTYVVWDGDAKYRGVPQKERRAIATNRLLLGLHKQALMDWPSGVFQTFAVFEDNIESTTKNETGGDYYEEWFERNCHHFGFAGKNECKKNPVVLAAFFEAAHGEGRRATTLESIVTSALAIRGKPGEMEMRSIGDRHKPSAFIELVTASERANGGSAAATG